MNESFFMPSSQLWINIWRKSNVQNLWDFESDQDGIGDSLMRKEAVPFYVVPIGKTPFY